MNKKILIAVVVLILVIGGYFLLKGGYQSSTPTAPEVTVPEATLEEGTSEITPGVKEVTVIGTEFAFSPALITVSAGEKVKLTFRNNGGAPHNLVIEGLGVSIKTIGGSRTDTIEFTAPAPGIYPIFCSVSGHRAAGMEGQLIVE